MNTIRAIAVLFLLFSGVAQAQYSVTYYIQGLFRQGDDALARAYLRITNTAGFFAGTNIFFTTNAGLVYINTTNTGGGGTSNYYVTNFYTSNFYTITTNFYTTNLYTITTNFYNFDANVIPNNGITQGVYSFTAGNTNFFRSLVAGTNMTFEQDDTNIVLHAIGIPIFWFTNPMGGSNFYATGSISNNYNTATKGIFGIIAPDNTNCMEIRPANFGTSSNTFIGVNAGYSNVANSNWGGLANTFVGFNSGVWNSNGSFNTYVGGAAGMTSTSATHNASVGHASLCFNKGSQNAAFGSQAMRENRGGQANSALGYFSLASATIPSGNVAVGVSAMGAIFNQIWANNTAVGNSALYGSSVSVGSNNVAVGVSAMQGSRYGTDNIGVGAGALANFCDGVTNVGIGNACLANLITGNGNIAIGGRTGDRINGGSYNIIIGTSVPGAINTSSNIWIGNYGATKVWHDNSYWHFFSDTYSPNSLITNTVFIGYPTNIGVTNYALTNTAAVPNTNFFINLSAPANCYTVFTNTVGAPISTNVYGTTTAYQIQNSTGLTVNVNVLVAGGTTNQLQFIGGILTGVVPQ